MVNFSRNSTATYIGKDGQLKTAAANEPRFEKEGLLIEGQSTNLVPNSKNPPPTSSETRVTLVASPYGDVFKFAAATTNNSTKDVRIATLTAGQLVTVSFIAKKAEIDTVAVGFDGMFAAIFNLTSGSVSGAIPSGSFATITPIGDGFYKATVTTTTTQDVTPSLRLKGNGAFAANAVGDGMLIGNIQAELLPFASSYIPTSGAAATRAQDICWIPVQNAGLQGLANEKTMSVVSNIIGVANNFGFILTTPWGAIGYTRAQEQVYGVNTSLSVTSPVRINQQIRRVARFTKGGGATGLFGNNRKDTETGDWMIGNISRVSIGSHSDSSNLPHFGHVRDLKIWLQPLSDEQIKAVA